MISSDLMECMYDSYHMIIGIMNGINFIEMNGINNGISTTVLG
jgi:hypothetical protein